MEEMYLHLCLKDWNSHRLNSMLRIVLALALFGVSPMLSQETVVSGRVTEMGITPSIIHVKKVIYPALQVADWTPEILVAENGSFDWNIGKLETPTIFELLAPPWSWMVLVRPQEQAKLEIRPGRLTATRLLGSPGLVRWNGAHPSSRMDSLMAFQNRANNLLSESLVLRMSGVAMASRDSLLDLTDRLEWQFDSLWKDMETHASEPVERQLLWQIRMAGALNSGKGQRAMDSLWHQSEMALKGGNWTEWLMSPGNFSCWRLTYGGWWKDTDADWEKINEAIFMADGDSLAAAMGPRWRDEPWSEVAAAWLDKAISSPSELTELVWNTFRFPKPFLIAYERLAVQRAEGQSGSTVGSIPWTLPNGELGSIEDQCRQPWKVILALKSGSGAARREREMFNQVAEDLDRRDVCWVVLSLDENEELWRETLSARRTLDETIGWVGNSPQIMERLGLSVIPQILVLDQDGRIAVDNMPLPSQGLGAHLLELLPKK